MYAINIANYWELPRKGLWPVRITKSNFLAFLKLKEKSSVFKKKLKIIFYCLEFGEEE